MSKSGSEPVSVYPGWMKRIDFAEEKSLPWARRDGSSMGPYLSAMTGLGWWWWWFITELEL